jgi:hypothetical protein
MNRYRSLNGMQKMMLRWEAFHPVNAVHIVEFRDSLSSKEIELAIRRSSRSLRLRPVEFCPRLLQFRYADVAYDSAAEFPELEIRRCVHPARQALQTILDEQLNRPFGDGVHWPWRFVQIDVAGSPTCLALVYQHAVTDARGASLVLREIVRSLFGDSLRTPELQIDPPPLRELFPDDLGVRSVPRRIAATMHEFAASSSCYQVRPQAIGVETIFSNVHATTVSTALVKQTARSCGGTVQDLLFAALFEGLGLLFQDRLESSRRKTLAIRAMVDLRRDSCVNVDHALAQLLGCMTVRLRVGPGARFDDIVSRVAQQTRASKERKSYRGYAAQLETMSRLWDCAPQWLNRAFSPRAFPAAGMISNTNLSDFLADEVAASRIGNYFRLTGTGPLSPMMMSVTTVGPALNITTTHHANKFSPSEILWLGSHVQARLTGVWDAMAAPGRVRDPMPNSEAVALRPAA